MSGQKEDSILKMENRFGSGGLISTEKSNMNLYLNRWAFSIKNEDPGNLLFMAEI